MRPVRGELLPGVSCPIGSGDDDDFAAIDREVHAVEDHVVPERLADPAQLHEVFP